MAEAVGKTTNAISNWELGNTSPTIEDFCILCKLYDLTPDQLLGIRKIEGFDKYVKELANNKKTIEELEKQKQEIGQ
ncbi:MAG: helix-turn-helix domain-containing protein [Butyrivibrio sp.]|nr:helix-turn-helix domain-containing protein [Butyrivibrio sp.]